MVGWKEGFTQMRIKSWRKGSLGAGSTNCRARTGVTDEMNSWLWVLSYAFLYVYQHPWTWPTKCQLASRSKRYLSPGFTKCPKGWEAKSLPSWRVGLGRKLGRVLSWNLHIRQQAKAYCFIAHVRDRHLETLMNRVLSAGEWRDFHLYPKENKFQLT